MTDDENRDESEDELRRRAEESFNTGVGAYKHGDLQGALERYSGNKTKSASGASF